MPEPTTPTKTAAPSATPAPTTPAAAPATPAAPSTPQPPAKPSTPSFFDEIDAIAKEPPKPRPAPALKKDAEPANPTSAPAATEKPAGESGTKDTGSAEDASSSEIPSSDKFQKAAPLRAAYDGLKQKFHKLEKDFKELQSKPPADDPEKKTLLERLEERDKRLKALEEDLRFTSFERTDEYKTKYEKPFVRAFNQGRSKTAGLKVTDAEGNLRQGTEADFDVIMRIPDDATAAEKAAEMFGNQAPAVIWHREHVQSLNNDRVTAIEEARQGGEARAKEMVEKQAREKADMETRQQKIAGEFKRLNDEAAEKYPQWFKPEDGDDKGNELLQKGYSLAAAGFNGANTPPEEMVKIHSAIFNKAAGFDRMVYKNTMLANKVKELETELAQFKKSEPTGGLDKAVPEKKPISVEEEIDALAR